MHWLDAVSDILKAETGDLRRLAQIAKSDYQNFYKGQDLSGCDLRGQDLRGFNLTDCNLDGATIDEYTKIDPLYDPRPNDNEVYFYFEIPRKVQSAVYFYANEVGYIYVAWAFKKLLNRFNRHLLNSNFEFYMRIINQNYNLNKLCSDKDGYQSVNVTILTKSTVYQSIIQTGRDNENYNCYSLALIIGIISQKIRPRSSKDYSHYTLADFGLE